ncbi:MAG TPA: hypothetical protein VGD05_03420 [Pyrinomonadaceae bacterium]|jgi:hypothetical protein
MSERREKKYWAEISESNEELFCFSITSHGKTKEIKMTVPEIHVFLREQLSDKPEDKEAELVYKTEL